MDTSCMQRATHVYISILLFQHLLLVLPHPLCQHLQVSSHFHWFVKNAERQLTYKMISHLSQLDYCYLTSAPDQPVETDPWRRTYHLVAMPHRSMVPSPGSGRLQWYHWLAPWDQNGTWQHPLPDKMRFTCHNSIADTQLHKETTEYSPKYLGIRLFKIP